MIKSKGLFLILVALIHLSAFGAHRAYGQIQAELFKQPRTETPSIEDFLASEDLTKFFGNYTDHLDELIQGLLKEGDVETSKQVLEHLVKLRLPMHKENPKGFPNPGGTTDAAWFLGQVNSHSSNAEARLALTLEILRNPMHGQEVEVQEYTLVNLISPLVQRFQTDVANVYGKAARLEVFKEYFLFLSRAVGGRLCSIAGPAFSELYVNLGKGEISQMIEWLETEGTGPLAKELAMAARLRIEVQSDEDPLTPISVAQRYYLFVLNDSTLPLSWRLETGRALVMLLGDRVHPDIIMKSGEVLADGFKSPIVNVTNWHAVALLKAYLAISGNRSEEWNSLGREIGSAWLEFRFGAVAELQGSADYIRDTMPALELVLATKNQEVLEKIPSDILVGTEPSRDGVLLLIEAGEFDHARKVMDSQWKRFLPVALFEERHYSKKTESNLPAFLTTIDSEGLRYFIEVLVKSVPDPDALEEGILPRSERLKLLAEQFQGISFEDPAIKLKTLSYLVIEPSTAEALAAPILEMVKGLDLGAVAKLDRHEAYDERMAKFGLAADHVMHAVALKDPQPIMQYLSQAMTEDFVENESSDSLTALALASLRGLSNSWDDWNTEDIAKFVPTLETLFSNPHRALVHIYRNNWGPDFNHAFIAFLASNKIDVLEAMYERSDEDIQYGIRRSTHTAFDLLSILSTTYAGSADHDPHSRYDLFYSMLAHPLVDDDALNWSNSIVAKAIELGVLTSDKVIENAEALIELIPQSGKTAEAVAIALTEQGDTDEALAYWDQAIASIKEGNASERSRFMFGKVDSLEHGGRDEEALWTLVAENWKRTLTPQSVYEQRLGALSQRRIEAGFSEDPMELTNQRIAEGTSHPLAQLSLAALYEGRGDRRRSEGDFPAALSDYQLALQTLEKVSGVADAFADRHVTLTSKLLEGRVAVGQIPEPITLVPVASEWRFSDEAADLGKEWKAPGFDDNDWKTGRGKFAYEGKEVTHVNFGKKSSRKTPTTYFRHRFESEADPAGIAKLHLKLLRDDGAVVYFNDKEVLRTQMPEGEITYETLATSSTTGADDDRYFDYLIDSEILRKGENVIAVEIHQASSATLDFGFDLSLNALTDKHLER